MEPLNIKNKKIFHSIYKDILNAQKSWTRDNRQIKQTTLEQSVGQHFNKEQSYHSIPQEIRNILDVSMKYQQTYQFKVVNSTCNVVMVYPIPQNVQENINIQTFFTNAIYKIYLWLHVAKKYASPKCSEIMNIYIYFTDHHKILAKQMREPLDLIHVNTAFTTSCAASTDIHLFRKEEWFKVLIHETFHNLGMDFSALDNTECNRRIIEMFPIEQGDVRVYESYCETWANLLNTLFVAFMSTHDKDNWDLISSKMEKMMKYEKMFSIFQCVKILLNLLQRNWFE
jgi:hypothetical protein